MTSNPVEAEPQESTTAMPLSTWRRVAIYLSICAAVGALSAVVWIVTTPLPTYEVRADHRAILAERGMTQIFQTDVSFVTVGFFAAWALGIVAWRMFRRGGWRVTALATVGSLVGAMFCVVVGQALTPGPLDARLARAEPGRLVPVEFVLASPSAIAVWPFGTTLILLALASLLPDPEERKAGE